MCVSCWRITLLPDLQYSTESYRRSLTDRGAVDKSCSESCEPDTVTDMLPLRREEPSLSSDVLTRQQLREVNRYGHVTPHNVTHLSTLSPWNRSWSLTTAAVLYDDLILYSRVVWEEVKTHVWSNAPLWLNYYYCCMFSYNKIRAVNRLI